MIPEIVDLLLLVKRDNVSREDILAAKDLLIDVGLDSLEIIEFLISLEQKFEIFIDFDAFDLNSLSTLTRVEAYVNERRSIAGSLPVSS